MDLTNKIKAILLESKNSDLSEEETKEFMDRILGFGEWEDIRIGLLNVLYDNDDTLWNEAITYLYYFQNKGYTYEAVKTIALLNDCLRLSDDLDSNLIWTITINIKSISYETTKNVIYQKNG